MTFALIGSNLFLAQDTLQGRGLEWALQHITGVESWGESMVNYLDNTNAVPADQLTSEFSGTNQNGFLDNATSKGYVLACTPVPSDINWQGSAVSSNGLTCQMDLTNPSCYAREYYFDYPSSDPIMRFIFVSAGVCGTWFSTNSGSSCPGDPAYSGWSKPVSPATCSTPPIGSEHYCWLKGRIDEAHNAGLWVAVALHKQCLSNGTIHPSCESTFDPFSLAISGGVDLWLDGHEHNYERSFQLSSCTGSGTTVSSCTKNTGTRVNSTYTTFARGSGMIASIIGTGGNGNYAICSTNCLNQGYFQSLCGNGGPVSPGCNDDYGFVKFTVDTNKIVGTFVSATGTFSDTYAISANNPPGDFGVSSSIARVARGTIGASGTYSSVAVVSVNSFGNFSGTVSLLAGSVSGGPSCPGLNCPSVSLSTMSLSVAPGGTNSTILIVSSTTSTSCSNPDTSPGVTRYTVTVTATSGSTTHQYIVLIYIYGRGDVDKSGRLNVVDLVVISIIFGSVPGQPNFDPNRDVNNDAAINIFDVVIVTLNFGNTGC